MTQSYRNFKKGSLYASPVPKATWRLPLGIGITMLSGIIALGMMYVQYNDPLFNRGWYTIPLVLLVISLFLILWEAWRNRHALL